MVYRLNFHKTVFKEECLVKEQVKITPPSTHNIKILQPGISYRRLQSGKYKDVPQPHKAFLGDE